MKSQKSRFQRFSANLVRLAAAIAMALLTPAICSGARREAPLEFRHGRAQVEQFIDYHSSIRLTAAQERIKAEALEAIPAPCCKDFSMKTCCCPCNLAKGAWGLSNYLIAKKGYGAQEVRQSVIDWLAFVNPNGFTGSACFKGGCQRPPAHNGCGGMDAEHVILGDDVQ